MDNVTLPYLMHRYEVLINCVFVCSVLFYFDSDLFWIYISRIRWKDKLRLKWLGSIAKYMGFHKLAWLNCCWNGKLATFLFNACTNKPRGQVLWLCVKKKVNLYFWFFGLFVTITNHRSFSDTFDFDCIIITI